MEKEHRNFHDWLKAGRQEPMDESIKIHLSTCETCRRELHETKELQKLISPPDNILSESQVESIRFRLNAECNLENRSKVQSSFKFSRRTIAVAIFSLGILTSVVFLGFMLKNSIKKNNSSTSQFVADIKGEPGSQWKYASRGINEIIIVNEGVVHFEVNHLNKDHIFGVKVGSEWVEVKGTIFTVTAKNNILTAVFVTRGVVSVHVEKKNFLLMAGQKWERPAKNNNDDESVGKPVLLVVKKSDVNKNNSVESSKKSKQIQKQQSVGKKDKIHKKNKKNNIIENKLTGKSATSHNKRPPLAKNKTVKPADSVSIKFSVAYRTYQSGDWRKAISLFRSLLKNPKLGSRRPDTLFWLSQAHLKGGQYGLAKRRMKQLIKSYPHSWRVKDVKKQLRILNTHH